MVVICKIGCFISVFFFVFDQILSEYLYLDVIYPKIALESTEKAATRFTNHYNKEFKASPDFIYEFIMLVFM